MPLLLADRRYRAVHACRLSVPCAQFILPNTMATSDVVQRVCSCSHLVSTCLRAHSHIMATQKGAPSSGALPV